MYPLDVKNALCNGGRWVWKGLKVGKALTRPHPDSNWVQSLYITTFREQAAGYLLGSVVLPGPPHFSQLSEQFVVVRALSFFLSFYRICCSNRIYL